MVGKWGTAHKQPTIFFFGLFLCILERTLKRSSLAWPFSSHTCSFPLLSLPFLFSAPAGMDGLGKKNTFFAAGMVGYSLGLLLTFSANILMHRGQPALIYIVPSLIAATLGTAAVTGRWEEVWGFNSEEAEEGVEGA